MRKTTQIHISPEFCNGTQINADKITT